MGNDNTLMIIAVVAVILSAIAFFVVLGLNKDIQLAPATGEEGTAQVEIIQNVQIDTTFDTIDFLSGFVNPGSGSVAIVSDSGLAVTDWLDQFSVPIIVLDRGFVIENIGNVDLDVDTQLEDPLDTWLPPGPSTTSATLDYKIRVCDTIGVVGDEADCTYTTQFDAVADTLRSCSTFNAGTTPDVYETLPVVGDTPAIDDSCDRLEFENTQDEMRLDLRLTLPEDIAPTTGAVTNRVILDIDANP